MKTFVAATQRRPHFRRAILGCVAALVPLVAQAQLPGTIDLNSVPGTEGTPVLRIYGDDALDQLGYYYTGTAFGDINGDGYDDMLLGAPYADPPGGDNAGEVYILYGSASIAASATIALSFPPGTNGETRILGNAAGDYSGWSVASGDVNGDGQDDVITGAPLADPAGRSAAGEVYIIYGSSAIIGSGTIDLNSVPGTNGETRILGDDPNDRAGHSVACGDINGDGYKDVILGAYRAIPPGGIMAGEAYIVYGGAAIVGSATIDLDSAPGSHGETRILGDDASDFAGCSVASGDINGDGYDDVILGAQLADPPGGSAAGEVYVIYGSALIGSSTLIDLNSAPGSYGETRILGDDPSDYAGWSLVAGDINGDGYDDVVVGARRASPPGGSYAGEALVIYGSASIITSATIDLNSAAGSNGETRILGDNPDDYAGWSLAGVDINGDGFDDVVVGARFANPSGRSDAGEVYVVYGSALLQSATLDLNSASADVHLLGDNADDQLGSTSGAGGDLDRDGFPEVAASAFHGDRLGSASDEGYAVAVFGTGIATQATRIRHSHAGDAPATAFGPVARCVIDYGTGPALSTDTVTITRAAAANPPSGAGVLAVLPVHWELSSTRSDFTADATFKYTDTELGGAEESRLVLASSPTGLTGSWALAGNAQVRDATRNEITTQELTALSFFTILAATADIDTPASPLDFGNQDINLGPTAAQTVVIANDGWWPLQFTAAGIVLSGTDTEDFILGPTDTLPLIPGAARSVDVSFDPSTTGLKKAFLTITTDDPDEATLSILLTGTAFLSVENWGRY